MLKGNLHMHGSYDMCVDLDRWAQGSLPSGTPVTRRIRGSYCGAQFDLPPGVLPSNPAQAMFPDVTVVLYLCLPDTCKAADLSRLMSSVSLPLDITVPEVVCQEGDVLAKDGAAIAAICVLCAFGLLIVVGTTLDVVRHWNTTSSATSGNVYSMHFASNRFDLPHPQSHTNGGLELQEKGGGGEGGRTVDVGSGEKQTSFIVSKNGGDRNNVSANGAGGGGGGATEGVRKEEDGEEEEEEFEGSMILKALMAFSLHRNTERVLGLRDVTGSVTCLHGIRVLSIFWLVVGNSVLYMTPYYENPLAVAEVLESMISQFVVHSSLAVDAFFLISGCLTALVFLREVAEEGGVRAKNVLTYFIHRYVRLTPAYAVTIMALTCLLPYMSDGPSWTRESRQYYLPCQDYWWTNLLYVNNFYNSLKEQCVPWGWYLAADLQFHWLVAPFIIFPLAFGYKVFSFLLIGGLVVMQGVLTYYFEADINGDYLRHKDEYLWQVFEKPYTRVAPFVLGLGLGFILTRVKGRLNIHKVVVVAGWLIAIGVLVACVLVKYDDNHMILKEPFYWSATARAWHETVFRILFSLALCWVVFMCATGYGGFINSMLSWKVFVPVSHLVFGMYLLHPAVILADMWQSRIPPYFTVSYLLQRVSGYILLSAIFAYFLSVTVETPVSNLERLILNKPRRRSSCILTAL